MKHTKILSITAATAASLLLLNTASAAPIQNPFEKSLSKLNDEIKNLPASLEKSINSAMGAQSGSLSKEISYYFQNGFTTINLKDYQVNPNLLQVLDNNTAVQALGLSNPFTGEPQGPSALSIGDAALATQSTINNSLQQLTFETKPHGTSTDTPIEDPTMASCYANGKISTCLNQDGAPITYKQYELENSTAVLSGVQSLPSTNINSKINITNDFINKSTNGTPLPIYPASDTIYIAGMQNINATIPASSNPNSHPIPVKHYVAKPIYTVNNMFNFSSLIAPTSYSTKPVNYKNTLPGIVQGESIEGPSQLQAAQGFIKFATQNTINPYKNPKFGFSQLSASGLGSKKFASTKAKVLYRLKHSSAYQKFKLQMRSFLALRSIPLTVLNQLVTERTPVDGLNIKNSQQQVIAKNVSPLQLEAYTANHRIHSANWFHTLRSSSQAVLQRKMLIVLAEIEHQNYEAHLDRERLLSELAALNLTMQQQSEQGYLIKAASDVNKAISNAIKPGSNNSNNNDTGTTQSQPSWGEGNQQTDTDTTDSTDYNTDANNYNTDASNYNTDTTQNQRQR